MAGLSEIVIEALRRIAKTDPDISSALGALRKRGIIDGISSTLGGEDGTGSDESCCSDNEAKEVEDPKDPWSEGEAPTEFAATPESVTDCATGQPVSFEPQGFPQAETCKECAPDPEWIEGKFWQVSIPAAGAGATKEQACAAAGGIGVGTEISSGTEFCIITLKDCGASPPTMILNGAEVCYQNRQPFFHVDCGTSVEPYCTITEAPEVCGDNWSPDDSTSYTLRNGCIVASKCDTDAPSGSLGCTDQLFLCMDGATWNFAATSDGGFILYDPTGQGSGGKYDETGKRTEILNPGETGGYI